MKNAIFCTVVALSALCGYWVGLHQDRQMAATFRLESAGICKVDGGGKTWLLVDMTQEFILPEDVAAIQAEKEVSR